ncbi:MAG TPA: mechanosensitive ion channel family protein [Egibacteraceae bacterium]|nr:mechanosensitive ion channel family protein [Egibacteraceae bacterium]
MRLLLTQSLTTFTLAQASAFSPEAQAACTPANPPDGFEPNFVCQQVFEWTQLRWLALASGTIFKVVFVLVLAWFATRLVRRALKRFAERVTREGMDSGRLVKVMSPLADTAPINLQRAQMRARTITGVIRSFAVVAIWITAGITVLGAFNINLGPLIAGAGIAGVALGFGAQNLVRDFLSGIFMLLEDQYGVGDVINAGEATGIVESVSLRTTRLRSVDGTVWYVPNGEIKRVGNMSHQWSRALLDIGVAYDTDLDLATRVIQATANAMAEDPEWAPLILSEPEVWGLEQWGESQLTIRLVVQTVPLEQWNVSRELRRRLKEAFDEAGIEIPFPQRTVWIRNPGEEAGTGI